MPALPAIVILIPENSATASIAAAHLEDELAISARIEQQLGADLDRARALWPTSWLILLDTEHNEAALLRPDDRALLVRKLPAREDASPYALAVAAAELVRLGLLETSQAQAAGVPEEEEHAALAFAVSLGAALSGSPGVERALAQPMLGFDVRLKRSALITLAGVRVRGPASSETEGEVVVRYRRTDLSIRLAFGPELGALSIFAVLEGGASFASVRAMRGADVLGNSSRTPFFIGGGGEVEYALWRSLRASAALEVIGATSPADFIGNDVILLSEGAVRVQGTAALSWVLE